MARIDGGGDSSVESSVIVIENCAFLRQCAREDFDGDGGDSDAEGDGLDIVDAFKDGMMAIDRERKDDGAQLLEEDVDNLEQNWCFGEVQKGSVSGIERAPADWILTGPPESWRYCHQPHRNEPVFETVNNPGQWSKYTFRAKFKGTPTTDKYAGYHEMPCGAQPVPVGPDGKRT
jgi:hypothetical protein